MRRSPKRVENYTNSFLIMTGVILFMGFFTLAAVAGFAWVLTCAALIEIGFRTIEAHR